MSLVQVGDETTYNHMTVSAPSENGNPPRHSISFLWGQTAFHNLLYHTTCTDSSAHIAQMHARKLVYISDIEHAPISVYHVHVARQTAQTDMDERKVSIMCDQNIIISKVEQLKEWQTILDEAEAMVESLKDFIKAEMQERGVEEMEAGTHICRFTTVLSNRFDSTAFKKVIAYSNSIYAVVHALSLGEP